MSDNIKQALAELDNIDDDIYDPHYIPPTAEEREFAEDIRKLFQEIVDMESNNIVEEFTSKHSLDTHFNKHCLGKSKNKQSTRTCVYYDFKDKSQYKEHERRLIEEFKHWETPKITSFTNMQEVNKLFRKFFGGNKHIVLSPFCGIHNNEGSIAVGIHSYASNYTTNYKVANTIDVAILTEHAATITIYPVDAYYLETKLNNILKHHSNWDVELKINND